MNPHIKAGFVAFGHAFTSGFANDLRAMQSLAPRIKGWFHKKDLQRGAEAAARSAAMLQEAIDSTRHITQALKTDYIPVHVAYANPGKYKVGMVAVRDIMPADRGWRGIKRLVGLTPPMAKILWIRAED